jgi:hypothetical protein
MHEGAEPLLAVGLVDGHAQLFRYRAREEGEESSSGDDDGDDDDGGNDDDDEARRRRRAREKRRERRLAAAAKADQPPVRRYASALEWSRAPGAAPSAAPPSCRAVRFMGEGGSAGAPLLLACGFGDGSLAALDASGGGGREVWRAGPGAHGAAVSRVLPLPGLGGIASDCLFAAGDEDGVLCVWDVRCKAGGGGGKKKLAGASAAASAPALRCAEHTDFISDLCAGGPRRPHMLLATSGDGTLSVHDARAASSSAAPAAPAAGTQKKKKTGASARRRADGLVARSEPGGADDELLSVAVARGGGKVVAGGQSGALSIFSWGEWEDPTDRFPGHPESVDALAAVDEGTLLTGSSDGLIRVIGLLPNRLMGVLGVHGDDGSPVERLAVGGGGGKGAALRALASSGHGECVRLWDLGCFFEEEEEDEDDEEGEAAEEAVEEAPAAGGSKQDPAAAVLAAAARAAAKSSGGAGGGKKKKKAAGASSSSDDDDDDDGDDSDSDSDDDERAGKRRRHERTRMTKQTRDGGLAAKQKANFFAGLLDE